MKKWHIIVSLFAIVLAGLFISQDSLARVVWQNFKNADVALFLDRKDTALAAEIG